MTWNAYLPFPKSINFIGYLRSWPSKGLQKMYLNLYRRSSVAGPIAERRPAWWGWADKDAAGTGPEQTPDRQRGDDARLCGQVRFIFSLINVRDYGGEDGKRRVNDDDNMNIFNWSCSYKTTLTKLTFFIKWSPDFWIKSTTTRCDSD